MNIKRPIGRLRLIAILEGISYLLFAITMPLKYVWEITEPNMIVGMAHGWLFLIYIVLAIESIVAYKWKFKQIALTFVASILPFGTFYADHKLFKPFEKGLDAAQ
ncbi:DUF3817 domain-containing protein [Sanyastnella coralliicola]|uniref:DUF3817 domain-containing protein n=1 Tax=Sanyastnella coralliicola TaxID=3069118 RepID=UPI0027BA04C2|nr:DUF3817 domain-containing protein [Longitalea sp. SCSIO 12813]